jgi:hypothetical protein
MTQLSATRSAIRVAARRTRFTCSSHLIPASTCASFKEMSASSSSPELALVATTVADRPISPTAKMSESTLPGRPPSAPVTGPVSSLKIVSSSSLPPRPPRHTIPAIGSDAIGPVRPFRQSRQSRQSRQRCNGESTRSCSARAPTAFDQHDKRSVVS